MQPQKIPVTIWIALTALLLLSSISISIAIHNPSGRSYPNKTTIVYQNVDYNKINQLIAAQIANIPLTKNGTNGRDGKNGADGAAGARGAQGKQGVSGKTIEIRHNDLLHRSEWQYQGDLGWHILSLDCSLTNICVVP